MRCVVCHGDQIHVQSVYEEYPHGADIVRIPLSVSVCNTCGERYYDRATLRKLEKVREEIVRNEATLAPVGKVLECRS